MPLAAIAIFVLAVSAPVSPGSHGVWEADIVLPGDSPVYVLGRNDTLDKAARRGLDWIDVVDKLGRTMPRGYELLSSGPYGPHFFIWFDNVGESPYKVRVGAKSARHPDPMSLSDYRRLAMGLSGKLLGGTPFPLAAVRNVRKVGTIANPLSSLAAIRAKVAQNNRLAALVAALAVIAVAGLAAADHAVRRRIRELRDRQS